MHFVVLTLIIGVMNLGIGYGIGVCLGYGPPTLMSGIEAILASLPNSDFESKELEEIDTQWLEEWGTISLEDFLDDEIGDLLAKDFEYAMYGEACATEQIDLDSLESMDLDADLVETSIINFRMALLESDIWSTEIDAQLRTCLDTPDPQTVHRCKERFLENSERYLSEYQSLVEDFRSHLDDMGKQGKIGKKVDSSNQQFHYHIETALEQMVSWDTTSDVEKTHRQMLKEIKKLRMVRHKHLDLLEMAFTTIAREKGRLEKIPPRMHHDSQTNLRNRVGLEMALERWVLQGKKKSLLISAAQFDLDAFSEINDRYGASIGDRILREVGQQLLVVVGKNDIAARFSGEQFMLVFHGMGPRQAIKTAEVVRQSLQRTTFLREEDHIQVTTSVGITGMIPKDTIEALYTRLDASLKEAKRSGGNRSFLHNGSETEPIEAPDLGAEFLEIVV